MKYVTIACCPVCRAEFDKIFHDAPEMSAMGGALLLGPERRKHAEVSPQCRDGEGWVRGWDTETRATTAEERMERRLNAAGFFLRDDRPIREGVECFKGIEEAYSLHTVNPFRRHHVFGGPRSWAVEQAHNLVFVTYPDNSVPPRS